MTLRFKTKIYACIFHQLFPNCALFSQNVYNMPDYFRISCPYWPFQSQSWCFLRKSCFIYLKESARGREGRRWGANFRLLVHFSNVSNSQGWARLKSGASASCSPKWVAGPQVVSLSCAAFAHRLNSLWHSTSSRTAVHLLEGLGFVLTGPAIRAHSSKMFLPCIFFS